MTRVLLVDDDRDVLTAYRTILARVGIEVADSVSSGADALLAERACHPDVVLLDLQMPQMSGADVLRAWRDSGREVRALVLTSFDDILPDQPSGLANSDVTYPCSSPVGRTAMPGEGDDQ